jgi:hydrogenase expression/formation protein HypE
MKKHNDVDNGFNCPLPAMGQDKILLSHGGGGKLMHELIDRVFMAGFSNPLLESRHDGAVLNFGSGQTPRLAFTTDSYVVDPIFFPGGNIGSLSIHGTVNDLAMCGARPVYLSAGFIIEEGFEISRLRDIVQSMKNVSEHAGVQIVTGDTKVVERGKCDGVYINTAGIGIIEHGLTIVPTSIQQGDRIILSGDIGRHGLAVMSAREGFQFETVIESDSDLLNHVVTDLLGAGIEIHCLRDLTRGGLATALLEIALSSSKNLRIDEQHIPVSEPVKGACEILGFDPLYMANEGRFVCFVTSGHAEKSLGLMRSHSVSADAVVIGEVVDTPGTPVSMRTAIGTSRPLDMITGEQLPRIC